MKLNFEIQINNRTFEEFKNPKIKRYFQHLKLSCMKKSVVLLFLFLSVHAHELLAQTRASKTFAKTFQLTSESEFVFDVADSVQVIQTENAQQARIMLFIDAYNTSNEMLKSLTEAGRYLIKTQTIGSQLYVSLPFMKNNIVVNGASLKESHYFIFYAPKNTTISRTTSPAKVSIVRGTNP